MNWSKAKTILIIILLITNSFLLWNYMKTEIQEENQVSQSTDSAVAYLQQHGIEINCQVPEKSEELPVVRVSFISGDLGGGIYRVDINGVNMEILGLRSSSFVKKIEITDNLIETLPAYTALLKSYGSVNDEITGIELIYLVDRSAYIGQEGEDTALPYWKISSGENSYYYSAFAE